MSYSRIDSEWCDGEAMSYLDCSSPETALDSLARLLGTSQEQLQDFSARDLDWHHPGLAEGDLVLASLGFTTEQPAPQPNSVRWFHATRVEKDTTFVEGILPFDGAQERVWPVLEKLGKSMVGQREWDSFKVDLSKSQTNSARRLRLKRSSAMWQGPFAHLLRQVAIDGYELPYHRSYTVAPEVVEELSSEFEARFKMSILAAYQAITAPCIVSFTRESPPTRVVGDALAYVYFSLRREVVPVWCNTVFSGYGQAVPREQVDEVHWL